MTRRAESSALRLFGRSVRCGIILAMEDGGIDLDAHGEVIRLLPERAAWVPRQRLLLVADLHLGKAVSFRRQGVPVPRGTTASNLQRLSALVERHDARSVVFLGDFLHSAQARAPATLAAIAQWRAARPRLVLTLVRGNHDRHAGDPPSEFKLACVDEPYRLPDSKLVLAHHPQRVEGAFVVAGHVHPGFVVAGGFERLRLPCFHVHDDGLVLPAFGAFTGTFAVGRRPGDRIVAVAGDRLVEVR